MKYLAILSILFFPFGASASNCGSGEGMPKNVRVFNLKELAQKYELVLRFESHLERDLNLIATSPYRTKFVINYADGTAISYPRKWCSLAFTIEGNANYIELASDWENCKAIAMEMRKFSKGEGPGILIHALPISGSNRLKLDSYCSL